MKIDPFPGDLRPNSHRQRCQHLAVTLPPTPNPEIQGATEILRGLAVRATFAKGICSAYCCRLQQVWG